VWRSFYGMRITTTSGGADAMPAAVDAKV
jgi:hypothetical protein